MTTRILIISSYISKYVMTNRKWFFFEWSIYKTRTEKKKQKREVNIFWYYYTQSRKKTHLYVYLYIARKAITFLLNLNKILSIFTIIISCISFLFLHPYTNKSIFYIYYSHHFLIFYILQLFKFFFLYTEFSQHFNSDTLKKMKKKNSILYS